MKNKLTMKDIALMANVTKSTVSRYFNGGYVKESTKTTIKEIVEKYGYEPNTFARLKAKKSNMIGIVTPCLDSAETSKLLMYLDETLQKHNYSSLIVNTNHSLENELFQISHLSRLNLDAIIVIATSSGKKYIDTIKNLDIPILFIGQKTDGYNCIINDNKNSAKKLCKYLKSLNYQEAVVLSVSEEDEAIGITRKNEILNELRKSNIKTTEYITSFKKDEVYKAIKKIIKENLKKVFICSTTIQIYALYKIAKEFNINIPDDISVCGYGARSYFDIVTPTITCIHFDTKKAGIIAGENIISLINKKDIEKETIISYSFNIGTSTKENKNETFSNNR